MSNSLKDTIAAVSTSVGEGGIGIVRLSGPGALGIADKVFAPLDKSRPSDFKSYTVHYGWITKGAETIDEVILTVMRAPKSYTKEDVVEINCHGGIVALRRVLGLVIESGARLAEPGEFTKRAFLNGRIDLAQAEAVLDMIRAKTDSALRISAGQLKGALSKEINKARQVILDALSNLEAAIDFPEEDIKPDDLNKIKDGLMRSCATLHRILEGARFGRVSREGIHAVICGRPNVGKSSLLNALLKQERSIVTHIAGTTRDTIEEIIDIRGVPVRIVDTAGILEPRDLVEKKAVERSKKQIIQADLVIIMFDGSRKLSGQDETLIRKIGKKQAIAVINKIDLKQKIDAPRLIKKFARVIELSASKGRNINLLEDAIVNLAYGGKISAAEPALVSNLRHITALREAEILIAQAATSVDNKLSLEFIAQDTKDGLRYLDDLLGRSFSEELLDKIFNDFCIGK